MVVSIELFIYRYYIHIVK